MPRADLRHDGTACDGCGAPLWKAAEIRTERVESLATNRHRGWRGVMLLVECPQCQRLNRIRWLEDERQDHEVAA